MLGLQVCITVLGAILKDLKEGGHDGKKSVAGASRTALRENEQNCGAKGE